MTAPITDALSIAMTGWIEPPDPTVSAEYWLTCRSADSAPGYDHGLPDIRVRYRWNGNGAWMIGYYPDRQGREAKQGHCLHSNNGWRIELPVAGVSPGDLAKGS